jgi:hypothetical protein
MKRPIRRMTGAFVVLDACRRPTPQPRDDACTWSSIRSRRLRRSDRGPRPPGELAALAGDPRRIPSSAGCRATAALGLRLPAVATPGFLTMVVTRPLRHIPFNWLWPPSGIGQVAQRWGRACRIGRGPLTVGGPSLAARATRRRRTDRRSPARSVCDPMARRQAQHQWAGQRVASIRLGLIGSHCAWLPPKQCAPPTVALSNKRAREHCVVCVLLDRRFHCVEHPSRVRRRPVPAKAISSTSRRMSASSVPPARLHSRRNTIGIT